MGEEARLFNGANGFSGFQNLILLADKSQIDPERPWISPPQDKDRPKVPYHFEIWPQPPKENQEGNLIFQTQVRFTSDYEYWFKHGASRAGQIEHCFDPSGNFLSASFSLEWPEGVPYNDIKRTGVADYNFFFGLPKKDSPFGQAIYHALFFPLKIPATHEDINYPGSDTKAAKKSERSFMPGIDAFVKADERFPSGTNLPQRYFATIYPWQLSNKMYAGYEVHLGSIYKRTKGDYFYHRSQRLFTPPEGLDLEEILAAPTRTLESLETDIPFNPKRLYYLEKTPTLRQTEYSAAKNYLAEIIMADAQDGAIDAGLAGL